MLFMRGRASDREHRDQKGRSIDRIASRGPDTARTKNGDPHGPVKEGRRGRTGGTLKSGPAIKRANYPPSRKCTPSNIFFLRSLREHSKRTRALAYASCISRRRARIMPRKSPRMHIIYGSGSYVESARGLRGTRNAEGRRGGRQAGRKEGGTGEERLIKLRVPRDVAFTRPNLPRKHICSGKPRPILEQRERARVLALFVAARVSRKRPPKSIRTVGQKSRRKPSG